MRILQIFKNQFQKSSSPRFEPCIRLGVQPDSGAGIRTNPLRETPLMSYGCDRLPPHSSRPCHTGIRSAPEPEAATFSNGRKIRQITAQPHSMASMPELPSVPTNEPDLPSQPPWFEQAIPQPLQDISDDLQPDTDIKQRLQDPELGVRFYHEQIARRQEAEEKGEDFTFAPLLVTLENMKRLTDHILANRHFPQPLTDDERDAFTRIQTLISQLTERKAPYKSTVQLAWLMMALQEMMVARHITPHLQATQPALFDCLRFWPSSFLRCSRWKARAIPLRHCRSQRFFPHPGAICHWPMPRLEKVTA